MIIAATGHRPDKLGGYDDANLERLTLFAMPFLDSAHTLISGMALGWDTAVAQAALRLGIPLHVAVPFIGQERRWPPAAQERYYRIIRQAHTVTFVSNSRDYTSRRMEARNKFMVNHCTDVLSLWNGSSGGTANCVRYALHLDKSYRNVWNDWVDYQRAAA